MNLTIAAVGRARRRPEAALYDAYAARIAAWPLRLVEVEARATTSPDRRVAAEADALRRAVPDGALAVALDRRGRALASRAFAGVLAGWAGDGVREVAFLIGGADGLDRGLVAAADRVLAFGPATWPHLVARALLAEQLYRAQQILAGHPYHRD